MRIAIMSDFHFGHGAGAETEQDAYEAVGWALERSMGCDLILMPGDLFDTRVPGTEALAKAMQLLIGPSMADAGARFVRFVGKDGSGVSPRSLSGIPVITIHGTHERRTKELMNPVQALETAGFAVHLHCNGVVFEKSGECVAVFGLSGVPDQYALDALRSWNPKPEPGCYNIFMLHQNIREFMPGQVEHAIATGELPDGFDLYVCGHIHEARRASRKGKPLLFPGSLIPTQLNKESLKPRGFFIVDTRKASVDFIEIEGQRRVYMVESPSEHEVMKEIEAVLSRGHSKKPLIRIKLPKGSDGSAEKVIRHKYGERTLLSFRHEAEEAAGTAAAKTLEEHVVSVQELGKKLLEKNLLEFGLDPRLYESVFELIADGRAEEAEKLLLDAKQRPSSAVSEAPTTEKTAETAPKPAASARKKPSGGLFGFV